MKSVVSSVHVLAVSLLALALSPGVAAQTAEEIMQKADQAIYTKSTRSEMDQIVVTPSGDKRTFKINSYSQDGSEKGLTVYVAPAQVRGMKILVLNDGDDIWSFFPRTNRTRKIASSARNRRVQGSDFSYDDMAAGKMVKQWKGRLLGAEKLAGKICHKLEVTPTAHGPQSYSKAVAWLDKENYTVSRIEFYDLDGDKLKRLDVGDYRRISGVLVPFVYQMTNLTDGGKTMMRIRKTEVNIPLKDGLFSEAGLSQ